MISLPASATWYWAAACRRCSIPAVEVLKLDGEDAALDAIHSHVEPGELVHVFLFGTMIAPHPDAMRELGIVGSDRAAFAAGTEVFARIEAEAAGDSKGARPAALVLGTVGLACILNHRDGVPVGDFENGIHIRCLAVQVNREDGAGAC